MTSPWDDPAFVARYAEGPPRMVPGLESLYRMAGILLAERCPPEGRILVLGAGGGLEMAALARSHPGWRFDGVDPSGPMLELARQTMGADAGRARLHQGHADSAPPGPFDGGLCLLTLHFLPRPERVATLREVHRRLVPGAAFVSAHHSIDADPAARMAWLERWGNFVRASGGTAPSVRALAGALPILSPAEDEAVLAEAGFSGIAQFYAAFTFRGWVAHA